MASHAAAPVAERIEGNLYRIYFTSRDLGNRSYVGWLELDITRPDHILRLCKAPVLGPGDVGSFDDAGATLSCIVEHKGRRFFYYIGWSLRQSVPYHLAIGLAFAEVEAGDPVVTKLPGPIVERNPVDPLFCTAPAVMVDQGLWRMWYVSGLGWPPTPAGPVPSYETRYAESEDGVYWRRTGLAVLHPNSDEYGFSRPTMLFDGRAYLMWYSIRGPKRPYHLGFARSDDGLAWRREDASAGLEPSADSWDSEMVAYPYVFEHGADLYMLYCGNGFGRTGFGLAVLE